MTGPYRDLLDMVPCAKCGGTGVVNVRVPKGIDKMICGECRGTGSVPAATEEGDGNDRSI